MANLLITNSCNNSCDFCFSDKDKREELLPDQLNKLFPFINSSGRKSINLVGGEPTLNPFFLDIFILLLKNNYEVKIFTNGRIPAGLVSNIQNINSGCFSFVINRSYPELSPELETFYKKLGYKIQLGITFSNSRLSYSHLIDEILTYNLKRNYRLGIALPNGQEPDNIYVPPCDYDKASHVIFDFIRENLKHNIRPEFDCGFPSCFFNEDQKQFFRENSIEFFSNCGVIPDILPGLYVIPCLPLKDKKVKLNGEHPWDSVNDKLNNLIGRNNNKVLFDKCIECDLLESSSCSKGCAALRYRHS